MSVNYDLSRKNNHLFPELVLHEICDFLNLSELKAFRLVCVQWYFVARCHIQGTGKLSLSTLEHEKVKEFASSIQSGGYSPVQNMKIFVCPVSIGCTCEMCQKESTTAGLNYMYYKEIKNLFRRFDDSTLETIIGKCSSGINSFDLFLDKVILDYAPENHFKINYERLLLLEQFKSLKELHIYTPFKLTPDSGINSVFRRLTSLFLGFNCGDESFAASVFNECCDLKSLTLGLSDDFPYVTARNGVQIVRIFDALKDAMKGNEYLKIDKINIKTGTCWPWLNAYLNTIIFSTIRGMNLNLKVLEFSLGIYCREPTTYEKLMNEVQDLLENQKDTLVKLVLPSFWRSSLSELKCFPQMKNLKELESNVNFQLPVMDLQSKFPVLETVSIDFFYHFSKLAITRAREEYNCPLQFANQLTQNIPPCATVTKLTLNYLRNGELLAGFNKMFPNVQSLIIDLQCNDLQKLWGCWPKIKELNMTVIDTNKRVLNPNLCSVERTDLYTNFELCVKFHAGLTGIPENVCEALLESSVPFLTLKVDKYDYNLPSIRDFSELTKLSLKCDAACNVALMIGILPMKNLMEVNLGDGQMTIDCVEHLLRCRQNINRWEFKGSCILKKSYPTWGNPIPDEWINWTVSSRNYKKHQPIYDLRNYRFRGPEPLPVTMYKTRLRSVNKYGRGRCLLWTPHHMPPSLYKH